MIPATLTKKLVYRGDTEEMSLKFEIGDPAAPYDLTVWSEIKMDVRIQPNQLATKILELSVENGGLEITGDSNERLLIHLNSDRTNKFNKGSMYYYDIRFIGQDGAVYTMLKGEIDSTLNITE